MVGVYPAAASVNGGAPSGSPLVTATVTLGSVAFDGLELKAPYVAWAAGVGVRFLVPEHSPTDSLLSRVDALSTSGSASVTSPTAAEAPAPSGDMSGATDTANLRAATTAMGGATVLRGVPGRVYTLKSGGTTTRPSAGGGVTTYPVAVPLPDSVVLEDMTVQPATTQDMLLFCNSNSATHDLGLRRVTIDGRNQPLTNKPLVWFEGQTDLVFDDLDFNNIVRTGGYIVNTVGILAPGGLRGDGCVGAPVQIGTGGASYPVRGLQCGPMIFRNVTADPANPFNFPGNPIILAVNDSTVAGIEASDAAAGVKIYNTDGLKIPGGARMVRVGKADAVQNIVADGSNIVGTVANTLITNGAGVQEAPAAGGLVAVGSVIPAGTTVVSGGGTSSLTLSAPVPAGTVLASFSSGNSGLKLQGGGSGACKNVEVGPVYAKDCDSFGLWDELSQDCQVESFHGVLNGKVTNWLTDVWLGGTDTRIGWLLSDRCGGRSIYGRAYGSAHIGRLEVRTPGQVIAANCVELAGGEYVVDYFETDGGLYGIRVTAAADVRIRQFRIKNWTTAPYNIGPAALRADGVSQTAGRSEGRIVPVTDPVPPVAGATGGATQQFLSSGRYIGTVATGFSTTAPAQGLATAVSLPLGNTGTIDRIGIEVTAAGEAGSVIRLGVYSDDGTGKPGALLLDAGTVPGDGATGFKELTIDQILGADLYWLVHVNQLCPTTAPTVRSMTSATAPLGDTTALNMSNPGGRNGYQKTAVIGALPATWGPTGSAGASPRPIVRAA